MERWVARQRARGGTSKLMLCVQNVPGQIAARRRRRPRRSCAVPVPRCVRPVPVDSAQVLFVGRFEKGISEPDKDRVCHTVFVDRDDVQPVIFHGLNSFSRIATEQLDELRRRIAVADNEVSTADVFQLGCKGGQFASVVNFDLYPGWGRDWQSRFLCAFIIGAVDGFDISIPEHFCKRGCPLNSGR